MGLTRPQHSLEQLSRAVEANEAIVAVHYACESIITAKDYPPGVASIAIYDLGSGDVSAFSRTDAPKGVAPADLELDLLRRFFARLGSYQEALVVHWNMNRPEYGFDALVARLRYLTAQPGSIALPTRRIDIDDLFVEHFGDNYAPHGRLLSMALLNDLDTRSALKGKDEADRFTAGDWSAASRSCASKAKIIGELFLKLINGTVKTASSPGIVGFAGTRLDAAKVIEAIAEQFVLVQRSLRKHPRGKPTIEFSNEWDDQYLFKALLKLFFDDVRDEEYIPSYAGSNSRIDYLLPAYAIGIELKHASKSLTHKEVGEQLIVDRDRYKGIGNIGHLICIVFDPDGWVENPRGLENDLRIDVSQPGMTVTIVVVDR
ncbi:PD-(D/E)XK nuclease domain-containing protein [Mycolicibacterium sp. HS_4_1]